MTTTRAVALTTALMVLSGYASATPDCTLGDDYHRLADKAAASANDEERRQFLQKAAEACPSFRNWQELGEVSADLGEALPATEAFAEAYRVASSPQEKARSAAAWAEVVFKDGDPQRAYQKINLARELDPGNQEIAALSNEIQTRIDHPVGEDIRRGWATTLFADLGEAGSEAPAPDADTVTTEETRPEAQPVKEERAIRIGINFEFNTFEVDAASRDNVRLLADEMARFAAESARFKLVGHADSRGSPERNLALSKGRAEAVRNLVVDIHPELAELVEVEGKGATQPVVQTARSEDDHRKNRRLEVFLL